MNLSTESILNALSNVIDPDLQQDIVTLKMVQNIKIVENTLFFDLVLTTPACPMKDLLENACLNAIKLMVGTSVKVTINITSQQQKARQTINLNANSIIGIASGKGGVGKSTVAANIAISLAKKGINVGLLDADIYGPSIPLLFGTEKYVLNYTEKEGKKILEPYITEDGIKLFSIGFISSPDDALVLRGPMISSVVKQFITDVNWGDLDYLIIDLPPGTGDIQITIAQLLKLDGVVIVTTPQKLAVADAHKAIAMFGMQGIEVPIIGIIENMSFFEPENETKKYYIFGKEGGKELALKNNLELLGQLPICENESNSNSSKILPYFDDIINKIVRKIAISKFNKTNK